MSSTSDNIFIQQFEAELFEAFQNMGGVMRGRLRRKTGVIGTRTHFPKIGLAPAAQPKSRNGKVPLLDIVRDRVQCDLADYYGADMIDSLDELKTNVDEKTAVQRAITMSLARTEDDIALQALAQTTNPANNLTTDDTWSSDAVPRFILQTFGNNEAMAGGQMHALITWRAWNDALSLNTFINADYGGDPQLTVEGQRPKMWFGFAYAPYSRLPVHSSGSRLNLWWNSNAGAIAVGQEITSEVSRLPDYDATFIMGKMRMGACIIESLGVVARRYAN
jgi:hypothetical protein